MNKIEFEIPERALASVERVANSYTSRKVKARVRAFLLGCMWEQDNGALKGSKYCLGMNCVEVPWAGLVALLVTNSRIRPFVDLLKRERLVKSDHSWVAPNIKSKELKCKPNAWHFRHWEGFDPKRDKLVRVVVERGQGTDAVDIADLEEADGKAVQGGIVFQGKWAVRDYLSGDLTFDELKQLGKVARSVLRGSPKEAFFRTYNALTLCPNEFCGRAFVDLRTGRGIEEGVDLNAAQMPCAVLAAGFLFRALGSLKCGYSCLNAIEDSWLIDYAQGLYDGTQEDFYGRLWKAASRIAAPRCKGLLGAKFTKGERNGVKKLMMLVCNQPKGEYMRACQLAYENRANGKCRTQPVKARVWLFHMALKEVCPEVWAAVQACRMNTHKDAWYQLYTFGEKAFMNLALEACKEEGIDAIRKHDAVYSCDPALQEKGKRLLGKAILTKCCGIGAPGTLEALKVRMRAVKDHSFLSIARLVDYASPKRDDFIKLRERVQVAEAERELLKHAMSHKEDYLGGWFCQYRADPQDWMLNDEIA